MSVLYRDLMDYPKAIFYLEKSLDIAKQYSDSLLLMRTYYHFGNINFIRNNINNAEKYFNETLNLSKRYTDFLTTGFTYDKIGSIFLQRGNKKKALIYFLNSLENFKKCENLKKQEELSKKLYLIYQSIGEIENALKNLELHLLLKDSISKLTAKKKLYKYEINKEYALKKQADSINFDKKIQIEKLAQDNLKLDLKQKESSRNYILIILIVVVLALGFIVNRLNVINKQRKEITAVNGEMNESIRYAQRLQEGILVPEELQKEWLPESFIYFKPKDVVSGDFYWLESVGKKVYIAAADCTGHGIPGAMVSMICSAALNKSLYEDFVSEPSKILDNCRALVEERFVRSKDKIKDGMDISLCVLDKKTNIIKWAGANNPLWVIKKGSEKVDAIKADKQPVGYVENKTRFTQHEIQLQKGDSVYLFSDGFQDQFGGEKGKKYMVGKMKKFLLSIQEQTMDSQLVSLDNEFNRWKGKHEQIDDVCIIGFEIT